MAVNPIPSGYHSITPSAVVDDATKGMEFYSKAFGAKETYRLPMGDKIGHAEMQIGDSRFMLSDEVRSEDEIGAPRYRGTHGQRPTYDDNRALFLAAGRGVRRGATLGAITSRDVAPTLTALLDLPAAPLPANTRWRPRCA